MNLTHRIKLKAPKVLGAKLRKSLTWAGRGGRGRVDDSR